MITVYDAAGGKLKPRDEAGDLSTSVWIDLQNPAEDEDKAIEQALGIEVPTRSEMREIEASNRFYTENGAYYMTGIILHNSSQDVPMTSVITFILSGNPVGDGALCRPAGFPPLRGARRQGRHRLRHRRRHYDRPHRNADRAGSRPDRADTGRSRAHGARRVRPERRWPGVTQPASRRAPENDRQGRRRDGESPGKRHVRAPSLAVLRQRRARAER